MTKKKQQPKAVFHIEYTGEKIRTAIDGNALDLIRCISSIMEKDPRVAALVTGAAIAWQDYKQRKTMEQGQKTAVLMEQRARTKDSNVADETR